MSDNHHGSGHHHNHPHDNESPYSHDLSSHNARMKSDEAYMEDKVVPVEHDLDYFQVRVVGLLNLLREKGIVTTDEMRRTVEDLSLIHISEPTRPY